jgi:thioredoxin-dependent peroxiredoxin
LEQREELWCHISLRVKKAGKTGLRVEGLLDFGPNWFSFRPKIEVKVEVQTQPYTLLITMKINSAVTLAVTLFMAAATTALADMPKVGDTAPAFQGVDQNGQTVKSSDVVGKSIVLLYFYPKDFTGGCTKEACGFRDRMADLQKDDVKLIGVSFDTADSHKAFAAKYGLGFELIADTDGKIADAYGARWGSKNLSQRVSFLIGKDGKIVHVTNSGNPQVHFDEMQAAIASLQKM